MKRKNYISWDEFGMSIALIAAQRSKDPNTQVGACILNEKNSVVGVGYNGFPMGCNDDYLPWGRDNSNPLESKYFFVCHAEENSILRATSNLENATLYTTLFPCNECAKVIIQSGIKEVCYLSNKYYQSDSCYASRKMFDMANVRYRKFSTKLNGLQIKFTEEKND